MDITSEDYAKLQKATSDPDKISLVMQADRLGVRLFSIKLEYENYPPRTPKNKDYDLFMVKWPDDEFHLLWFVVTIPKEDLEIAQNVAKETGLKLVNSIPMMITQEGDFVFPVDSNDNIFTIENHSNSKIYQNDFEQNEKLKAAEEVECEKIINADKIRINDELKDEGYSEAQIVRIWEAWEQGRNHTEKPSDMT